MFSQLTLLFLKIRSRTPKNPQPTTHTRLLQGYHWYQLSWYHNILHTNLYVFALMRHSQPISIGTCIESYINITSVLLVCGLPAAGKSTICSKVMSSDLVRTKYNEIIEVNYDRITVDISSKLKRQQADDAVEATGTDDGKMAGHHFTDIDLEAWRKTRTYALEHLESLFQRQKCDQQNVTRNSNTLINVDDNFFLRSMRREVYKICQRHVTNHNMIGFSILHVDVPVEVCLKRNKSREGKAQVPDAVIERMVSKI